MSTKNITTYFTESNGTAWNNYSATLTSNGGGALYLFATVNIPAEATDLQIYYNVVYGGVIGVCTDLNQIVLTNLATKASEVLWSSGKSCWSMPNICSCPDSTKGSSSVDVSAYNGTLQLGIYGTTFPGTSSVNVSITAYATYAIQVTSATLEITIYNPGSEPASGAAVNWSVINGPSGSGTANSSGQYEITGIDEYEQVNIEISYAGITYQTSIQVTQTQQTQNIFLSCPSGETWSSSTNSCVSAVEQPFAQLGKYILIAAGVIGGTAVAYEIAKSVSYHEEGVARFGK